MEKVNSSTEKKHRIPVKFPAHREKIPDQTQSFRKNRGTVPGVSGGET